MEIIELLLLIINEQFFRFIFAFILIIFYLLRFMD